MLEKDKINCSDFDKVTSENSPWILNANKTFLITGATGLVGTTFIKYLSYLNEKYHTNYKIIAMVRNKEKAIKRFKDDKIEFLVQDIRQPIKLDEKIDFIVDCASNADPKLYATQPVETIQTNVYGISNLLEFCRNCCVDSKLLFASSIEVYGNTSFDKPLTETDFGYTDCNTVRACYTESKRLAETLCKCYHDEYGINTFIARLCKTYGPYITDNDTKVMAQIIRKVSNGENIVLKSNGMQKLSFCYSLDVVTAMLYILYKGNVGEAYNVSDKDSIYRLKDIAMKAATIGKVSIDYDIPTEIEKKGYTVINDAVQNSEKLESLGWKSKISMDEGLERSIQYVKTKKL